MGKYLGLGFVRQLRVMERENQELGEGYGRNNESLKLQAKWLNAPLATRGMAVQILDHLTLTPLPRSRLHKYFECQ